MSDAIYSAMYSRNAELYHHGIQGQKWGIRNGPPYPLGSGASPRAFIEKYSNESYKGSKKSWDELDTYEKINSALLSISVGLALVRTGKAIQRWHDRRAAGKEKKTNNSSVNAEYKGKVKKEMENLTNAELSKEIQRMRLENEYNRLSKESKSEGRKWLEDTGKRVATQVIASSASLLVNRYGNKALDAISGTVTDIASKQKILKEERSERPSRKDLKETAKTVISKSEEKNDELYKQKNDEIGSESLLRYFDGQTKQTLKDRSTLIKSFDESSASKEEKEAYERLMNNYNNQLLRLGEKTREEKEKLKKAQTHIY